jgi:hypothetical protein
MSESIVKTLTVTNGAYTAKDVAGGLITFQPKDQGCTRFLIPSVKLAGVAAIPYTLVILSADIATPALDNAPFALVAADGLLYKGHIPIAASDYIADSTGGFNLATVRSNPLEIDVPAGKFYGYLVAEAVTSPGTTTIYLTLDLVDLY